MAFLDVEKAFDCVSHASLWTQLRRKGLPNEAVNRLQGLYSGAAMMIEWQSRRSSSVSPELVQCQRCPS